MKYSRLDFELLFESTRSKRNCYSDIIGIDSDGDISYGYDGCFEDSENWTPEEKKELAEYMISRWKKYGGLE